MKGGENMKSILMKQTLDDNGKIRLQKDKTYEIIVQSKDKYYLFDEQNKLISVERKENSEVYEIIDNKENL